MVVHATDSEYKNMASNKLLPKFHINTYDITNVNSMFGTNLAGVRGRQFKKKQVGWK